MRFKGHLYYPTSDNPQPAYAIHSLHTAHEYVPMKIAVALLYSTEKAERISNLENYYIQFFHQHNLIIKKQTQKEKNPLFELSYDIHLHHACA